MTQVKILKNAPVPVRDGTALAADVFHADDEPRPVILTMGPYGKDIHFEDFNAAAYSTVEERGPYMNWETVNPEWWVPAGYTVVRVDQRGTGASPGRMELQGPQEYDDLVDVIAWAADQPWSTGRVALMGISYYAMNQWHVAALRPRGLAAIVPWEGAVDLYREWAYHGGILSNVFTDAWWPRQITGNQHGLNDLDGADPTRALPTNADFPAQLREHPLLDDFYAAREADLSRIEVPVLSSGNWGGFALHLRGNIEGWLAAGTDLKWLEVHHGNHFAPFYSSESRAYQKRFLDRFLLDADSGWDDEPPVKLFIRTSSGGSWRAEQEWPLARTAWTSFHLSDSGLSEAAPSEASTATYDGRSGGTLFESEPLTEDVEVTGPSSLRVWVSTTGSDADLFVTLDNVLPDGTLATFEDASGMPGPVTKGWLRASHRELDRLASTDYRPVHTHTTPVPLEPHTPVAVDIEVMPTSMVFEAAHRIRLTIRSCDDGEPTRFRHDDPAGREALGDTVTLHFGPNHPSYWLAPVIPVTTADESHPAPGHHQG